MYVSNEKPFIDADWKVEYELNKTSNDKVILNVGDFSFLLYYCFMLCTDWYEIEKRYI